MLMLCAFPAPCGNEEILKKYIVKQYPAEWEEDNIGNLIYHKKGAGKKVMLYVGIDEDAFLVMDKKDKRISFAHFGNRAVYPGEIITFGGYKGIVCAENKEKPAENQYIELIEDADVFQGYNGVFDAQCHKDESVYLAKEAGKRAALKAILSNLNVKTDYDLYIVLGVLDNNGFKGAINASNYICPDTAFCFEQSSNSEITYKLMTDGFMINSEAKQIAETVSREVSFDIVPEINKKEKSVASAINAPQTIVFGVPVKFVDSPVQTVNINTENKISEILNKIF